MVSHCATLCRAEQDADVAASGAFEWPWVRHMRRSFECGCARARPWLQDKRG